MNKMRILSVNTSEKKGTVKLPVEFIELDEFGIKNDSHSGKWHRQVSILGAESIGKFSAILNRSIKPGEFAENITLDDLKPGQAKILDRFSNGEMLLEVTQIGKKCHGSNCAIFRESGECVMPKEGIFCRVIKGGVLHAGDFIEYLPKVINIHVITLSDRASAGFYEDRSGPQLLKILNDFFTGYGRKVSSGYSLISDDADQLRNIILEKVSGETDLIFTTGGTGIGERDIAPDVVKPLLKKEIPGIMELIRVKYGMKNPNALISRAVAGVSGKSLIYTLPGSVNAINEYTSEILPTLEHSILMLYNTDNH